MTWLPLAGPTLLAVAIVVVPGWIVGRCLGWHGVPLVLTTPAIGVSVVASAALLIGLTGQPFNPLTALLATLAGGVALLALRVLLERVTPLRRRVALHGPPPPSPRAGWPLVIGAVLGSLVLLRQTTYIIGTPFSISQSYDVIFHLNAVRYIGDTGNASSLLLGNMVRDSFSPVAIYPAAWHALVYLVWALAGVTIPAATNAVTLAVAALVWPFSLAFLGWVIRLRGVAAQVGLGMLAASFSSFPSLMLKWGVLYPNLLGYAMLPVLVALPVLLLRTPPSNPREGVGPLVTLAFLLPGLTMAHPTASVSWLLFALPALILWSAGRWSRPVDRSATSLPRLVITAIGLGLGVAAFATLRPGDFWPPPTTRARAVGEWLLVSPMGFPGSVLLGALVLIGVWQTITRRDNRYLLIGWAVTGGLWVAAASLAPGPWRSLLAGNWYGDAHRLASLLVLPAAPLAALGIGLLATRTTYLVRSLAPRAGRAATQALGTTVALLVALSTFFSANQYAALNAARREYLLTPDSLLITQDEQNVLDRLDEFVPEGAVIAINPWDGSALAYALENRHVTQYHSLADVPARYKVIADHLRDARRDPNVCKVARSEHVEYYLDFVDTLNIGGAYADQFKGFQNLPDSDVVQAVYTSGAVGLYRVTACG